MQGFAEKRGWASSCGALITFPSGYKKDGEGDLFSLLGRVRVSRRRAEAGKRKRGSVFHSLASVAALTLCFGLG